MKPDFIEKLPPDAQKEFLKLAMKLDEKTKQEKVHKDFLPLFDMSGQSLLKENITKKFLKNLISLRKVRSKD